MLVAPATAEQVIDRVPGERVVFDRRRVADVARLDVRVVELREAALIEQHAAVRDEVVRQPIVELPARTRTSWISPWARRRAISRRWNASNHGSANAPASPRATHRARWSASISRQMSSACSSIDRDLDLEVAEHAARAAELGARARAEQGDVVAVDPAHRVEIDERRARLAIDAHVIAQRCGRAEIVERVAIDRGQVQLVPVGGQELDQLGERAAGAGSREQPVVLDADLVMARRPCGIEEPRVGAHQDVAAQSAPAEEARRDRSAVLHDQRERRALVRRERREPVLDPAPGQEVHGAGLSLERPPRRLDAGIGRVEPFERTSAMHVAVAQQAACRCRIARRTARAPG